MASLEDLQLRREADAVEEAVQQLRELRDRPPTERPAFVGELVAPLAAVIAAHQNGVRTTRRLPVYGIPLLALEPDKLALLTLRELFAALQLARANGQPPAVTQIARSIGQSCRLERRYDLLRGRARQVEALLQGRNRKAWNDRTRAQRMAAVVDGSDWEGDHLGLHLGRFLLQLAVDYTGAFRIEPWRKRRGRKLLSPNVVHLLPPGWRWLSQREHLTGFLMAPVHRPMLVPPVPWTSGAGGGYLSNSRTGAFPLVKPRTPAPDAPSPPIPACALTAVNALQETSWRISRAVFAVLEKAWEQKIPLPGVSHERPQRLPDRPPADLPRDQAKPLWRRWRKARKTNSRLAAGRKLLQSRREEAGRLLTVDRFYFPYQLDSRGRIYPIPQILHPQADDLGRALLEFADGAVLTEQGEHWLAIHLANTYGLDKESFAARRQWVDDHREEIAAVALAPLEHSDLWADENKVDKPWRFLAACQEWMRFQVEGPGFLSHLPVSVDGTCNGLQHLSALGRDPLGGAATNLLPVAPEERPADLYRLVLHQVEQVVRADAAAGNRAAKAWENMLTRKVVKRATMTTPYGVTPSGMRDQLLDEFAEKLDAPARDARYLARVLETCIPRVVTVAPRLKKWFSRVARLLAEDGRGVAWTAPSGFRVTLEHRVPETRRIGPRHLTMEIQEPGTAIAVRKQQRSITPNFIHSLDAAHLAGTVSRLHAKGLRHISTVHDCYAVHACHVDRLTRVLREEFVALHREPLLERFLEEQPLLRGGRSYPRLPRRLNLDLEKVLESEYFFC